MNRGMTYGYILFHQELSWQQTVAMSTEEENLLSWLANDFDLTDEQVKLLRTAGTLELSDISSLKIEAVPLV